MALVIFLLPSLHCLTLSFQAFFSCLHWHFRELGIPKIKVSNDHFFCVWENGFLTLLTRLDFLSIWTFFLFNYEISHIASNTLHIFHLIFWQFVLVIFVLHQSYVAGPCSSILGQGLLLGFLGLLLLLCTAAWAMQFVSGCWPFALYFNTLIAGLLEIPTVPWAPWIPSALVCSILHCMCLLHFPHWV